MERLLARLRDRDDLAAGGRAVLGVVARADDLDLAHHVRRVGEVLEDRDHAALAHEALLHGGAVEDRLVARLQAAVDARVERVRAAAGRDARHEQDERGRRAGAGAEDERQVLQGLGGDAVLVRAAVVLHGGGTDDLDLLGLAGEEQPDVEADVAVRGDQDAAAGVGLEPRNLPGELVGAGDEVTEGVGAARFGRSSQLHAGARVLEHERDARDGRSGRVEDRSGHGAVEALRVARYGQQKDRGREEEREGQEPSIRHSGLLGHHQNRQQLVRKREDA